MTTEELKRMLMRPLEAFHSKGIAEFDRAVDEIYAPDYRLHDPGSPNFGTGPEALKNSCMK